MYSYVSSLNTCSVQTEPQKFLKLSVFIVMLLYFVCVDLLRNDSTGTGGVVLSSCQCRIYCITFVCNALLMKTGRSIEHE